MYINRTIYSFTFMSVMVYSCILKKKLENMRVMYCGGKHKYFHRAIEKKTYKKYIFDKTACQTNSVPRRMKCLRQTFLSY